MKRMNRRADDVRKSCAPRRKRKRICQPGEKGASSLKATIEEYMREYQATVDSEVEFYKRLRSLREAIRRAARCEMADGKRHPHQYRITRAAIAASEAKLLGLAGWKHLRNFGELHKFINEAIGSIHGIGPLTVYDVATRIGARLGLAPERVYLHAGTTYGARALGIDTSAETVEINELPREFHSLTPSQIEDCLCIFKDDLRALAGK